MKQHLTTKMMTSALVVSLSLLGAANAQSGAQYTLTDVLAKSSAQTNVVLAQTELKDADINLNRLKADPLVTKPDLSAAQQRYDLARANALRAPKVAQKNLASAFTQMLTTEAAIGFSQERITVSKSSLNIAQIRQKNGSGTALAVENARADLNDAERALQSAQSNLSLSRKNLTDLIGPFGSLVEPGNLPAVPPSGVVAGLIDGSPTLLQARQRLESAQLQVSLLDPSYTAKKDMEAAASGLDQARKALADQGDGLRLQMQNLYDAAVDDSRTYGVRRSERANSAQTLGSDQRRYDGGIISQIQLAQTKLADVQADFNLLTAKNDYLNSYYALQVGAGTAAGGR